MLDMHKKHTINLETEKQAKILTAYDTCQHP